MKSFGSAKKRASKGAGLHVKILITAIFVLTVTQVFNAGLSISSFKKFYLNGLVSSYQVIAVDLKQNIESAVRFGKPLEKFSGIMPMLESIRLNNPDVHNISIIHPDGNILYSLNDAAKDEVVELDLMTFSRSLDEETKQQRDQYILIDDIYHIVMPIKKFNKTIGWVDISFEKEIFTDNIERIQYYNAAMMLTFIIIASIMLAGWMNAVLTDDKKGMSFKKKMYILLFVFIGGAQVFYSSTNVFNYRNDYINTIRQKSVMLSEFLRDDVEYLFTKNIEITKLTGIDETIERIIAYTPEIRDIKIVNKAGEVLYLADKVEKKEDLSSLPIENIKQGKTSEYKVYVPLYEYFTNRYLNKELQGYININLDRDVIFKGVLNIIMDSLTVVIISFLFLVEVVFIFVGLLNREVQSYPPVKATTDDSSIYGFIRSASFIFFLGYDFSISFLPLYMEQIYKPLFGLSKDVVIGLPISAEMLACGLAFIFSGRWIDRKGWHTPYIVGVVFAALGIGASGLAQGSITLIIARFIAGLGFGLVLMASQGFIFNHVGEKRRATAIANLFAGVFAGSICGGAAGAMIAERIGYSQVFFVAAALALITILFIMFIMRHLFVKPDVIRERVGVGDFLRFVFNKDILFLAMFSGIPAALTLVGLLYYLSPLYLNRIGISQSNIGRIIMIFGLTMIYISPYINRWVDSSENKKKFLIFSGILGSASLLIFQVVDGAEAVILAILFIGLASSFCASSGVVFALQKKAAGKLGQSQALGIYRSMERVGQILGPIVFGTALALFNLQHSLVLLGLGYLGMTFLFAVVVSSKREVEPETDS